VLSISEPDGPTIDLDAWCLQHGNDKSQPESHVVYLDANLQSWAMGVPTPFKELRLATNIDHFQTSWTTTHWNGKYGAHLEVDLEHLDWLHDLHRDLLLATEHLRVNEDALSPWTPERFDLIGGRCGEPYKLVPHLKGRERDVIHAAVLKRYLRHGSILKRVHKAVTFRPPCWLKPWVDLNTRLRLRPGLRNVEKDVVELGSTHVHCESMAGSWRTPRSTAIAPSRGTRRPL